MLQINPKVHLLGYGPTSIVEGKEISPENLVAFSSMMTYKDASAIDMIKNVINSEKDIDEVVKKNLKNSVRRGHASMTTSAGLWVLFKNTSKNVDSLLTGARFASSLMPSSRRIPVNLEAIMAPDSIVNSTKEVQDLYEITSRNNIQFYMDIMDNPIPKEEAAKITQYGIRGDGFMFLPLETILACKNDFLLQGKYTPKEGFDIIKTLEEAVEAAKMGNLYNSREAAGRFTYPHVNIFSNPEKPSEIKELQKKNGLSTKPILHNLYFQEYSNLREELENLINMRKEITSSPESVQKDTKKLLASRNDIISRYRNSISIESQVDSSWRVWGEVKRHRTLNQNVESIYNAIERSSGKIRTYKENIESDNLNEEIIDDIDSVFMIPTSFKKSGNERLLLQYIRLFSNSLDAYNQLVSKGIPKSDAVALIPRGIRVTIQKQFDLYNILEGYMPLRCCTTAESEMRETTNQEIDGLKTILPAYIIDNIGPKCANNGHCLEPKTCGKIKNWVGFDYTQEVHEKYFK